MPKASITIVLFFTLLNAAAFTGQSPAADTQKTIGMNNGRYWRSLNEGPPRSIYLTGMLDGWSLSLHSEAGVSGKYLNIFGRGAGGSFTTDDLADMITSVYANTENINLPITWVAMGCLAVVRGETTRDLVFPALRNYLTSNGGARWNPHIPVDIIEKARSK